MTLGLFFFSVEGGVLFFFLLIMEYFFFLSELHVHFYMPYTITSTVFLCAIMVGLSGVGGGARRHNLKFDGVNMYG